MSNPNKEREEFIKEVRAIEDAAEVLRDRDEERAGDVAEALGEIDTSGDAVMQRIICDAIHALEDLDFTDADGIAEALEGLDAGGR